MNQAVSGASLNLLSGGDLTLNASATATTGDMLLSTGGVFANTVGPNVLTTPGRWLVYSKSAEANAFGGLASGNTGIFGTRLADYSPADITSAGYTGNRYVFLDLPPAIVVTTVNATRVYGDTPSSLNSTFSVAAANTYGGVIVAPMVTCAPVISSVGESAIASVGSYAITADVSAMTADVPGYSFIAANTGTLGITPRPLSLTGGRVYDATTNIAANLLTLGNIVNGDTVNLSGTGILSSKNTGIRTLGDVGTLAVSNSNYTAIDATAAVNITPAVLTINGVTANNKIYDASSAAAVSGTAQVSALASDVVSVAGSVLASFTDKNVGSNKAVSVSGYTLQGTDAGNYSVQQPTGLTASISPAALTINGVTANNKIYDASSAAAVSGTAQVSALASDVVSVAGSVLASFTDKNVGSNKAVSVSGYTLQGTDAGNYSVQQPTGLTADIIASPAAPGTAPATPTTTPITTSTSTVTATTITNSAIPLSPLLETTRNLSVLRNIPSGGTLDTSGLAALITGGVSITQINDLPAPAAGEVSIVAAQADAVAPNLWHFPLPLKVIRLLDSASAPDVKATLLDYSPLPVWLRFDYDNKTFVTSALPPDALPVGVLLAVGEHRAVVRIVAGPSKRVAVNAPGD